MKVRQCVTRLLIEREENAFVNNYSPNAEHYSISFRVSA